MHKKKRCKMSNRVHIICHPKAGNGLGGKVLQQARTILTDFSIEYIVYETNYATHASILTNQIVNKGYGQYDDRLMVIGGDGTLHEVVGQLVKNKLRIPITYIAAGTGNDFARTWLKNASVRSIIEAMLYNRDVTNIPLFTYNEHTSQMDGVILNNMGFGFDAKINYNNEQKKTNIFSRLGLGSLNYLISLFTSLPQLKSFSVSGEMDGISFKKENCVVAAILNSPFAGGGITYDQLTLANQSEIVLVLFHDIKFKDTFSLIYSIFIAKNQHESDKFTRYSAQELKLSIQEPVVGHVDGEVIQDISANLEINLTDYPFYFPN